MPLHHLTRSMAELALQELPRFPQDGPIRTAIDAKNYKKAIQLIDKRLKSTDKFTEFLLVSVELNTSFEKPRLLEFLT